MCWLLCATSTSYDKDWENPSHKPITWMDYMIIWSIDHHCISLLLMIWSPHQKYYCQHQCRDGGVGKSKKVVPQRTSTVVWTQNASCLQIIASSWRACSLRSAIHQKSAICALSWEKMDALSKVSSLQRKQQNIALFSLDYIMIHEQNHYIIFMDLDVS